MRWLSFQSELFDKRVDLFDVIGMVRQSAPGVARGILGLVAIAQNRIGANEPYPPFDIVAVGVKPIG
jgi:hypothetical protein